MSPARSKTQAKWQDNPALLASNRAAKVAHDCEWRPLMERAQIGKCQEGEVPRVRLHDLHTGQEYTVAVEARYKSPISGKGFVTSLLGLGVPGCLRQRAWFSDLLAKAGSK